MRPIPRLTLAVLSLIFLFAPLPAEGLLPVDGNIRFSVIESTEPPQLMLMIKTQTAYPYAATAIVSSHTVAGSTVDIRLSGILEPVPENRMESSGPARTLITLPVNNYVLRFTTGAACDEYLLQVGTHSIRITGADARFTVPIRTEVERLRQGSFFTYRCRTAPSQSKVCSDLAVYLKQHFVHLDDVRSDPDWELTQRYGYDSEGALAKALEFLDSNRAKFPQGMDFSITDQSGREKLHILNPSTP